MPRKTIDVAAFLPIKPTVLHILLSLADEPRYGYAIIKEVEERTGGRVQLKPGAFYRLLSRAVDDGLVGELGDRAIRAGEDERRRYYGITRLGRRVAAAEIARMEELAAVGRSRGLV